jgi:hypothetical protein
MTITMIVPASLINKSKSWLNQQSDKLAVALMTWMLSKEAVQEVVLKQMTDSGKFCRMISTAASDAVEETIRNIEASDIDGIGQMIEDAVGESEISADQITGLDDAISEYIANELEVPASSVQDLDEAVSETIAGDESLQEELTKAVMKKIAEKMAK